MCFKIKELNLRVESKKRDMNGTEIQYMQEALTRDMIVHLCEVNELSLNEAMNIVYNSDTYRMLWDPVLKLYTQSTVYLCDCLEHELKFGKIYD